MRSIWFRMKTHKQLIVIFFLPDTGDIKQAEIRYCSIRDYCALELNRDMNDDRVFCLSWINHGHIWNARVGEILPQVQEQVQAILHSMHMYYICTEHYGATHGIPIMVESGVVISVELFSDGKSES